MATDDELTGTCAKCGQTIKQFDTNGGHWVGDLESGGKYECPAGGLHEPKTKLVIVSTVCTATVRETWSFRLPEGFDHEEKEISNLIDVSLEWAVDNEISDERDREIENVEVLKGARDG